MIRAWVISPSACGGYWLLDLHLDGESMGGARYPKGEDVDGFDQGYQDALDSGENWIGVTQ